MSYSVANMEQNKEKLRHILQYYYDKSKNASHAANKICAVYGPDTVSISTAQRWFQRIRSGAEGGSKMRHGPEGLSSKIAIKSLN